MNLVKRFKDWLKNEVQIDYEAVAVDIRGVIEHVEAEFTAVQKHFDDTIAGMKQAYDNEIKDLKDRLSAAVSASEAAIESSTKAARNFEDWLTLQAPIKAATDTAVGVASASSAPSAATAPTVGATDTPASAAITADVATGA